MKSAHDSFESITIANAFTVNRVGLGTNRLSFNDNSVETLLYAAGLGIQFFDTAHAYTNGQSEKAIGETLFPYKNSVVATKGGMHAPDFHVDLSPKALSKQLEESLKRLKAQTIQLYFLHRVDPSVPLSQSLLFLKDMQRKGKISHVGLCEVGVGQIEEARNYIDVAAVENQYSIAERKHEDVLRYCEKEHIVFIPFYPLHTKTVMNSSSVKKILENHSITQAQLAISWLLHKSSVMAPIPGTLSKKHLEENIKALTIQLSQNEMQILNSV